MVTHKDIWRAIDLLAESNGLSASGLARKAGLDPTTFNPSKRQTNAGKLRWPSTESLAKILDITGEEFNTFACYTEGRNPTQAAAVDLPLVTTKTLTSINDIDANYSVKLPSAEKCFALEVLTEDYQPVYRAGDILIIRHRKSLHRGDRALVVLSNKKFYFVDIIRDTTDHLSVKDITTGRSYSFDEEEIDIAGKILWVSQ